uniref:hypothetical protein n=1 Tax=Ferrimicrobium sp. TaxID=2926050 RepID=UPI00260D2658
IGLIGPDDEHLELFIPPRPFRGFSSLVVIVRRGGEVQYITDRLDPPLVLVRVDERYYLLRLVPG